MQPERLLRDASIALACVLAPLAFASAAATPVAVVEQGSSAQVKVLCSNGLRAVVQELVPQFERTSHHAVEVEFGPTAVLKQRIDAGELFDVAILTPEAIDDEIGRGRVAPTSRVSIAQSPLGLAMRAGSTKPAMDSVAALAQTLRAASTITYATQGASAQPFESILARLGLSDAMQPKFRLRDTGAQVGDAVASGVAQFGVIPLSEILPVQGVELAGLFPEAVQSYLLMVGAVAVHARDPRAAGALLSYLTLPVHVPVLEAKGMQRP